MRLIDTDDLGVGRCSKDVFPAAYCAGWNGLLGLIENAPNAVQGLRALRHGRMLENLLGRECTFCVVAGAQA